MNISMKKGLLALAGAVALAGAGSAQAATYVGTTILTAGGTPVQCVLTLTATPASAPGGTLTVTGATVAPPTSPLCNLVVTSNFNWTATYPGGTMGSFTLMTPRAQIPELGVDCFGDIEGIIYTDSNSDLEPETVQLNSLDFGDCTIEGTLTLQ
ncbi:hypothetical protein [Alloalcanivorax mobilis]|uniref:hypothetical protein n=1 Tax=Alloalcanivorax mobilis TaxID=2019569 RepID=UPI000C75A563|nr:hypothetical protein [Alloalcanivorax mobilis]